METQAINNKDIEQIKRDIDLIKNILMSEGELTGWAKKQLAKARKESEDTYTSLEEL
jgi:hypothetical protein